MFSIDRLAIKGRCLELVQGDITHQAVDAIVNAANSQLAGGGGVDGAIHRRGGPEIMKETRRRYPEGCPTGKAVISSAGDLDCRYVIHAVGPVWQGGHQREAQRLRSAYHCCLQLAAQHDCQSVAFPSLSTGAYRFPIDQASEIALRTCSEFLRDNLSLRLVRFVLFDDDTRQVFADSLKRIVGEEG